MGKWTTDAQTHVAHMTHGDFYANEKSATITDQTAGNGRIEFVGEDSSSTVLKASNPLQKGDVVDATMMSRRALRQYFRANRRR